MNFDCNTLKMKCRKMPAGAFGTLAFVILLASTGFGQAVSISLSNGATFQYDATVVQSGQCIIHHTTATFDKITYSNFAYVSGGVTSPLAGSFTQTVSPGPPCPLNTPKTTLTLPLGTPNFGLGINFTPEEITGTAVLVTLPSELVYPKYQVQSIIYSTPGNRSVNGFMDSTTHGSTTTVGSNLQTGNSATFSISGGFLGIGSTLSWTYGQSTTNGSSTAQTSTITQASGVANATGNSAPNSINHLQDLFVIWINPAVEIVETGPTAGVYAVGTQLLSNGEPEIQDQVEVFALNMMANPQGATTIPLSVLQPQINGLPGLANICANIIAGFPQSCSFQNQCGCVPSDFAPILALDPLLNFGPTDNPLNANTSGTTCANPAPSNSCRYIPVVVAPGSSTQLVELLAGPQSPGGNIPINTTTLTDTNQTTQTFSESFATTVASSIEKMVGIFGTGFGLKSTTQWTWTQNESTGAIDGAANSMSATFSSSTVGCNEDIAIFEDTVFHTFVFQQPAGNTSCP